MCSEHAVNAEHGLGVDVGDGKGSIVDANAAGTGWAALGVEAEHVEGAVARHDGASVYVLQLPTSVEQSHVGQALGKQGVGRGRVVVGGPSDAGSIAADAWANDSDVLRAVVVLGLGIYPRIDELYLGNGV